jgi:hypothetical protein
MTPLSFPRVLGNSDCAIAPLLAPGQMMALLSSGVEGQWEEIAKTHPPLVQKRKVIYNLLVAQRTSRYFSIPLANCTA